MAKDRRLHPVHAAQLQSSSNSNSNSNPKSKSNSKSQSQPESQSKGDRRFIPFQYYEYIKYASPEKEEQLTRLVQGYHSILQSIEKTNKTVQKRIKNIKGLRDEPYKDEDEVYPEFFNYVLIMEEAFDEIDSRIESNNNDNNSNNNNNKTDDISHLKIDFSRMGGSQFKNRLFNTGVMVM